MPSRKNILMPCCCFGWAIFTKLLGKMPFEQREFSILCLQNGAMAAKMKLPWQDFHTIPSTRIYLSW